MNAATATVPAFIASPTRLRNGDWGARVTLGAADRAPVKGDRVRVTTAGGKSWDACVERVVWDGGADGPWICATVSVPHADQCRRDPARRDDGIVVGSRVELIDDAGDLHGPCATGRVSFERGHRGTVVKVDTNDLVVRMDGVDKPVGVARCAVRRVTDPAAVIVTNVETGERRRIPFVTEGVARSWMSAQREDGDGSEQFELVRT